MKELTEEQAIELGNSKFYEDMTYKERALFQTFQERLCMPFDIYHEAMEKTLGRPVFTHEFRSSNINRIRKELMGEKGKPTFDEIVNLIPKEKRIILTS